MRFNRSKYHYIRGYTNPLRQCPVLTNPRSLVRRARRRVDSRLALKQWSTRSVFLRNDKVIRLRFGRRGRMNKIRLIVFPNLFRHLEW